MKVQNPGLLACFAAIGTRTDSTGKVAVSITVSVVFIEDVADARDVYVVVIIIVVVLVVGRFGSGGGGGRYVAGVDAGVVADDVKDAVAGSVPAQYILRITDKLVIRHLGIINIFYSHHHLAQLKFDLR